MKQGSHEMVGERKRVYGNDMLYVTAAGGSKVGRVNLETGRVTMDDPDLRDVFDRFVAGWRAAHLEDRPPTADQVVHDQPMPTVDQVAHDKPKHDKPAPSDIAGASAQHEYDRRSTREMAKKHQRVADDAQWRDEIKAQRPVIGRVTTALTAKPKIGPESQATAAWKVGAEGERRVGEVLQGVGSIEVLHDRLIPGGRANIDHIVVGPAGVFVVDAKKYQGRIEVRDKGGMFRYDPHLYVNGRDRTKQVDGVLRQVDVVGDALSDTYPDINVNGVLCFIGPEWNWIKRPLRVKGVVAVWPKGLPKIVAAKGPLNDRVVDVADHLRSRLRPAHG